MTTDEKSSEEERVVETGVEVQEADVATAETAVPPESNPEKPSRETSSSFLGQLNFNSLLRGTLSWLSHPFNVGLLLWILAVTAAGGILFMDMVGMLNTEIPTKASRDAWAEACNQILNALFTLWVLLVQPWRIVYAIWVIRWQPRDQRRLRKLLSRAGADQPVPNERRHMAIVVVFLNLNCLLQYCMAGVMWGISYQNRSPILVGALLGSAFGCVAVAGLYCLLSPLGRPKPLEPQMTLPRASLRELMKAGSLTVPEPLSSDTESSGGSSKVEVPDTSSPTTSADSDCNEAEPKVTVHFSGELVWHGHLFGCFEDWRSAVGVAFCCCYAFGKNLQQAGFGNRFLHMVMFILFLGGPFVVCEFAAFQISNNRNLRLALILSGIVLSFLGLTYGAYWRSQLVKMFRLPKMKPCGIDCGFAGEYFLWLPCPCCSLCQEIRTVTRYGLHVDLEADPVRTRSPSNVLSPAPVDIRDTSPGQESAIDIALPDQLQKEHRSQPPEISIAAPTKQSMEG